MAAEIMDEEATDNLDPDEIESSRRSLIRPLRRIEADRPVQAESVNDETATHCPAREVVKP